mgnify:CR=1 FL=1
MSEYIKCAVKKVSLIDKIKNALKREPLTTAQLAAITGVTLNNVATTCKKNPDIFVKCEEKRLGDKRFSIIWKLKENDS